MAWSDRTLAELRRAKRFYGGRILRWPGVVGLGIGWKLVDGQPQGGRCLRVYVEVKRPDQQLRAERLPRELPLPAPRGQGFLGEIVALDVIEVGDIWPASRPLVMGEGCSREQPLRFTSGTMGAIVRDQQGRRYLLSNNHVLADVNRPGGVVLQPSVREGGGVPADVIGSVERFVPIRPLLPNFVDAALALLQPGVDQGTTVPGLGAITQVASSVPNDDTVVRLFGSGSNQLLRGRIRDREVTTKLVDYGSLLASFRNLIMIDAVTRDGDSGSLVVTETRRAVGLVVSRSAAFTFVCPMKPVLDLLGSSASSTGTTNLVLSLV